MRALQCGARFRHNGLGSWELQRPRPGARSVGLRPRHIIYSAALPSLVPKQHSPRQGHPGLVKKGPWLVRARLLVVRGAFWPGPPKDLSSTSKALFCSPRALFHSPKDLFHSPQDLFCSPKDLFRSPKGLFRSPKDLFRSPKDLLRSPKDLFHSPEDLFRSPKDLFCSPKDLLGGARPLSARGRLPGIRAGGDSLRRIGA